MQSIMLKAKIHQARVTHSVLDYEGSCAIDGALLEMTGLREFEQIQIYNITNGNRFTTYIIRGEDGSGIISVNGAAARLADVGDKIIIAAYGNYDEKELETFKPKMLYMNEDNSVSHTSFDIPVQVA
ncbi:aspartate 1-decarboxylase [Oceanobacter kriegii]|uniref:aspartate 1-decarboxylase n=1 Tax=Oceanobacter kriegii TaxID=64972 RepID=UPI00041123C6|nr:aspartate 1-decarboxylase [Oceanobacter kriegii]